MRHKKTPPVFRGRSIGRVGRRFGARRQAEQSLAEGCRWEAA
jgi:hypothetical protein